MNDTLKAHLTSPWVQEFIRATRLVRHLLSNPRLNDPQTIWAYDRLKPDLVAYECQAEGFKKVYLDRTEEFTHVVLRPRITVRNDDGTKVHRALKMARKYSLIAASLKSDAIVEPEIIIEPSAAV